MIRQQMNKIVQTVSAEPKPEKSTCNAIQQNTGKSWRGCDCSRYRVRFAEDTRDRSAERYQGRGDSYNNGRRFNEFRRREWPTPDRNRRWQSQDRRSPNRSRNEYQGRSGSSREEEERQNNDKTCYHYGIRGHIKRECRKFRREIEE